MNEVEQHQQEVPFHVNYIKALCVNALQCVKTQEVFRPPN